jgi:DNA recombination protein RmuC
MTASALDFTTVIAFVLGAIVATVLLMMTVLRANANDARALRETLAARDADLATERVATATVQATIAQMKLGERDVEERLQRVAQTYVTEAREVLVKTAAERLVAQVTPLNERLDLLGKSLVDLGTARIEDQTRVATLLESLSTKMAGIDDATRRVERVLGHSQARGSWGEFELKRLLELTGMTEHVSFETQQSGYGTDATGRPDVVLHIPGNLTVPIDAKVPFARYQEAVSAQSEAEREPLLDQAVAAIRSHVKVLGARRYHDGPACIGWTIMFVPIEAMLATLFARDHEIFEVARAARVLIASPLTLMLYLEAFSRGWAAQKQSENATVILEEARLLVSRLGTFTEKFGRVGATLNSAVEKYNDAVASYEGRLGPQARKIVALRGDTESVVDLTQAPAHARIIDTSRLPAPLALEA